MEATSSNPIKATAEVTAIEPATHDVLILRLRLPDERFHHAAGQYVRLAVGGYEARDYSIASLPGSEDLEFHIRYQDDGGASAYIAKDLKPGESVSLEGPFGTANAERAEDKPIIGIAGSTGLAPIKAIAERILGEGFRYSYQLYFGVRTERDVYQEDDLLRLAKRYANFEYRVVLSEEDRSGRRRGMVTAAIEEDFEDLSGHQAFVAGPPAMVDSACQMLLRLGMSEDDIHADAFTPGPALPQESDTA